MRAWHDLECEDHALRETDGLYRWQGAARQCLRLSCWDCLEPRPQALHALRTRPGGAWQQVCLSERESVERGEASL